MNASSCSHPAHAHSTADLRDAVRAVGLRATGARIAVLRCLRDAKRPLSHAEVVEGLEDPAAWDRATVYRNLSDLAKAGLLRRYDLGDHVWRFEVVADPCRDENTAHSHAHFLCTECGDVQCLDALELTLPAGGGALPRAVQTQQVEVQVRGVCDTCA